MNVTIAEDDPQRPDVRELLDAHLAFARATSPPEHVHALGHDGLLHPSITFFSARRTGTLLGVGALKHLDQHHAELKSMHTSRAARGHGVGTSMVRHLLAVATVRGYGRVSLETGTMADFAPARRLYAELGFVPCPPFAQYTDNPHSTCMTISLDPRPAAIELEPAPAEEPRAHI